MRYLIGLTLLACLGVYAGEPNATEVQWREWGEAAFKEARDKERPIALFVVCSWAQASAVLEQRTLRNATLVKTLNEHFIPVRVDRERRPDIDVRYQEAVRFLSKANGWPLVAFLAPDGNVLLGGTFWRLLDDFVREQPGLARAADHTAKNWGERRRELTLTAAEFGKQLAVENPAAARGDIPKGLLASTAERIRKSLLPPSGWMGPRFPQPCGVDLLLQDHARNGNKQSLAAAQTYLEQMLEGAIYDRLNGGFHRFSQDPDWRRPRWEKMLSLNAEMLRVLAKAFTITGEEKYRDAAVRAWGWALTTLADRKRGGFAASQAAGCSPEDPGHYYTWSVGDVERVLQKEALRVFCAAYDIREWGDWPEKAPHRNSLFVAMDLDALARETKLSASRIATVLVDAERKVAAAVKLRRAPSVDPTILVDANARMVSALLQAAGPLKLPKARAVALKTLNRLLKEGVDAKRGVAHAIGADGEAEFTGLGADEAALALACLDAFEATGEKRYLTAARMSVERLSHRFLDAKTGAFLDRATDDMAPPPLGRLRDSLRPVTDTPGPSLNAMAADAYWRLGRHIEDEKHAMRARETVRAFGRLMGRLGHGFPSLVLMADRLEREKP